MLNNLIDNIQVENSEFNTEVYVGDSDYFLDFSYSDFYTENPRNLFLYFCLINPPNGTDVVISDQSWEYQADEINWVPFSDEEGLFLKGTYSAFEGTYNTTSTNIVSNKCEVIPISKFSRRGTFLGLPPKLRTSFTLVGAASANSLFLSLQIGGFAVNNPAIKALNPKIT